MWKYLLGPFLWRQATLPCDPPWERYSLAMALSTCTVLRPYPVSWHSASFQVDPHFIVPQAVRDNFQSLLREYVSVFDPQFPGYNRGFKIQQRGWQQECQKINRFYKQNNNFARASHLSVHFFADLTWKCLILHFMENVNKQQRNLKSEWVVFH